jgi:hypothetical protein
MPTTSAANADTATPTETLTATLHGARSKRRVAAAYRVAEGGLRSATRGEL